MRVASDRGSWEGGAGAAEGGVGLPLPELGHREAPLSPISSFSPTPLLSVNQPHCQIQTSSISSMNRLFGASSSKPKPSLTDAIASTDLRIDSIEVKIRKLDAELTKYRDQMRRMKGGPGKVSTLEM